MDDDCFIRNKLEKSDFFHIKDGKVVPSIITARFDKIEKGLLHKNYRLYKKKAELTVEEQNVDIFKYSKYLTYLFIVNYFNLTFNQFIFLPRYSHNAVPMNLNDIKEVYDLVYNSSYKYTTIDCPYRHYEYLHFQILVVSYTFIKYKRRVKNIPYKLIQLNETISPNEWNKHFSLLCINKAAGNYSSIDFYKSRIIMEYLFPKPTNYEKDDYSLFDISFNLINSINEKIKEYNDVLSKIDYKKEIYFLYLMIINLFFLLILKLYNIITIHNYNFYDF